MKLINTLALAGLIAAGAAQASEDDITAGAALYNAKGCIGCHGAAGKSANPSAFPALAGKSAESIVEQLTAFKNYTRRNPMMNGMAAGLSDDDMKKLGAYLAAQK